MTANCKGCRFSFEEEYEVIESRDKGVNTMGKRRRLICRRYPPQPNVHGDCSGIGTTDDYPVIEDDGWCGEFEGVLTKFSTRWSAKREV